MLRSADLATRIGWNAQRVIVDDEVRYGVYAGERLVATLPTRREAEVVVESLSSEPEVVVLG